MRGIRTTAAGLTLASFLLSFLIIFGCSDLPNKPQTGHSSLVELESIMAGPSVDVLNEFDQPAVENNNVTVISGGTISIPVDANSSAEFNVPPRAVGSDVTITIDVTRHITRDGERALIFEFGPDGLIFSKSAILTIDAGAFIDSTVNSVAWYYYNPETGKLELQDVYDVKNGKVEISVDHFSRYVGISQGGQQ